MSVWLSYRLSDFLLFTPHTYYRLFALYNRAVWPLHLVAFVLGLALLLLLLRGGVWRGRAIAAILAACWLWVAWGYLYQRYDTINWAARYAAVAFAVQAGFLIVSGLILNRFTPGADTVHRIGAGLVAFALLVQPLFAPLFGRSFLQMEFFGLAPDPTVAATIGALVAIRLGHWPLLIIPLFWCALTGATLWAMAASDATLMPAIGMLAIGLTVWKAWARTPAFAGHDGPL
ncbi:MAG: DUF6064 family protein [Pseudolabrys sp.]